MSKSSSHPSQPFTASETADLAFLLRAMQSNLDLFDRLQAEQLMAAAKNAHQQIARLQALQLRCLAGLRRRRPDQRELACELALALHLTDTGAGAMIAAADALTQRLPRTFRLMDQGKLDLYRAMKVTAGTSRLSEHHAKLVDLLLENRLADKNPTQIRKATAYAATKTDPKGAETRLAQRHAERRVMLRRQDDGVAQLSVDNASPDKATAAYLRVDRIARSLKTGDERRTLDQIRADVAIDLLLSGKGGAPEQPEVYLYVDLQTYLGINNNPAELAGHGHIPAELARHIAAGPDTTLRRVITDPLTGRVIEVGKFRYRPNVDVDEFVRVRDRECRQPGCPRPAQGCVTEPGTPASADADTTLSYCVRHRRLVDRADWTYDVKQDGKLIVTTPTGERVESSPPPLHEPQLLADDGPGEERIGA
jgi:hypothetical protein